MENIPSIVYIWVAIFVIAALYTVIRMSSFKRQGEEFKSENQDVARVFEQHSHGIGLRNRHVTVVADEDVSSRIVGVASSGIYLKPGEHIIYVEGYIQTNYILFKRTLKIEQQKLNIVVQANGDYKVCIGKKDFYVEEL